MKHNLLSNIYMKAEKMKKKLEHMGNVLTQIVSMNIQIMQTLVMTLKT